MNGINEAETFGQWWAAWWPWYSGLMGPGWAIWGLIVGVLMEAYALYVIFYVMPKLRKLGVHVVDGQMRKEAFGRIVQSAKVRMFPGAQKRVEMEQRALESRHDWMFLHVHGLGYACAKLGPLVMCFPFSWLLISSSLRMFRHMLP
jgi:hypothetical protein